MPYPAKKGAAPHRPKRLPVIPNAGVYALVSKRTGAMYVGSAMNMQLRRNQHIARLNSGIHTYAVREAFGDHARAEIDFRVLEIVHTGKPNLAERRRLDELLIAREQHWIGELGRTHKLLNRNTPRPRTASGARRVERKHSEAVLAKRSAVLDEIRSGRRISIVAGKYGVSYLTARNWALAAGIVPERKSA